MRHAIAIGAATIAWVVVAACSSSNDENNGQQSDRTNTSDASLDSRVATDAPATIDASDADVLDASDAAVEEPCDAGMECPLGCRAGRCLVLTPSNLPPDICDTPGTKDFTGGWLSGEPYATIPQGGGVDLYVYKFANVSGDIQMGGGGRVAIVATQSMRLGSAPSSGGLAYGETNPGAGKQVVWACGGSGGGHGTPGGPTETPHGSHTAQAYGSETGIPLLPGSPGGTTDDVGATVATHGGYGGRALQLVSCGALTITGNVSVDGLAPEYGSFRTAGAGGGSGGTLLIEAASVSVAASGSATSNGGPGNGGVSRDGVTPGGAGGTATSPPGASTCGTGELFWNPDLGMHQYDLGAGAGGAVGRIRINVRAGTQPQLLGSVSPVPSIGAVATH